ncbi:copper homeostasis periplasmic binding protein CopC [Herbaspirillum frisingense]|uniref:copper homeostasis periplasmic binding protein CopC n=1 Tax=Herbaspirillum frisingense TaxID=92645 RepID=UPI0039AED36F
MKKLRHLLPLALLASLAFTSSAWAHAHLKSAAPADQAVVAAAAAPADLTLVFTEGLNLNFSGLKLLGPEQQEIKLGQAMLMDQGKSLMVPVPSHLGAGKYTVQWHVLSVDGHKTEGSYHFTVAP